MTKQHFWRRGTKVGRTLYCDERLVGIADSEELADELVRGTRAAHVVAKIEEVFHFTAPEGRLAKIATILNSRPDEDDLARLERTEAPAFGDRYSFGGAVHRSVTRNAMTDVPLGEGTGLAFDDPRSHPAVLRMICRRLDDMKAELDKRVARLSARLSSRLEALEPKHVEDVPDCSDEEDLPPSFRAPELCLAPGEDYEDAHEIRCRRPPGHKMPHSDGRTSWAEGVVGKALDGETDDIVELARVTPPADKAGL